MQRSNQEARTARHPSIQASSMGVDALGQYCVFGTRRHLILIDLDQPQEVKRKINRQSNWDVTQVQWNPCVLKKEYFATSHSQTADIWTYNEANGTQLATLKGHTRTISDMDWCPCDEDLIATCSVDTFINVWDIRDTKRPKMTPSAVAGACQVKWNKASPYILATAHDGDIRIWDIRKGRTPMQYITAHLSKIHSLDWSHQEPNILASSGQDTTVRFWNTSQPSIEADFQISAGAPVWKARYTPFGYGMVTTLMPQMHRWDNSALLWNVKNTSKMVHSYAGHRDVILEFGWRYTIGERTAELVTWSKDHSLFLWRCDSSLLTACGCGASIDDDELNEDVLYDDAASGDQGSGMLMPPDTPQTPGLETGFRKLDYAKGITAPGSASRYGYPRELFGSPHILSSSPSIGISGASPVSKMSTPPSSLERELINIDFPNLCVDDVDSQHRTCVVAAWSNYIVVKIRLTFPQHYPNNVAPIFQLLKPTNIRQSAGVRLVNSLRERALSQVRKNLPCLEVCLRFLSTHVDNMLHSEMMSQDTYVPPYPTNVSQPHGFSMYGTYQHLVKIPFPRTSGARFCGAGQLVTFMRPTQVKGFEASADQTTPRCLVALLDLRQENLIPKQVKAGMPPSLTQSKIGFTYGSSPTTENPEISVKSFYYREKRTRKPKHSVKNEGNSAISSEKLQMRLHKAAGKVVIQDLSTSLPMNRTLAEEYIIPTRSNYIEACGKNREVAEKVGRKDLVELWSTLELIQSSALNDKIASAMPWAQMTFGRQLLSGLITHYSKLLDVQTLAMISCMFSSDYGPKSARNNHPWHAIGSPGSIARSLSYNSFENDSGSGSHRSNSFCDYPSDIGWSKTGQSPSNLYFNIESPSEDYRYLVSPVSDYDCKEEDLMDRSAELLDRNNSHRYDTFKQAYANVLDRWKLVNQKTQILKYKQQPTTPHLGLTFRIICQNCHFETQYPQCTSCSKFAIKCALCRLPVKKLINFCFLCGHGGHLHHMDSWFETSTFCATGCGCECRPNLPSF